MVLEDKIVEVLGNRYYKKENDTTKYFDRVCEEFICSINEMNLTDEIVVRNVYFKSFTEGENIDINLLHALAGKKHIDIEVYTNFCKATLKLYELRQKKLIK